MKTTEKIAKLNSVLTGLITLKPRLAEFHGGKIDGCTNLLKQLIEEEEETLKNESIESEEDEGPLTIRDLMLLKTELEKEIQGKLLKFQELANCNISKLVLTRIPMVVNSESKEVIRPEELLVSINVTFNPRGE